ncbi:MAG: TRAP transporter substrate-binding protein [Armatimonadetes bacterium]|nr:TRAP transporter substrate-binding protein [Armatimonadota bacterium]
MAARNALKRKGQTWQGGESRLPAGTNEQAENLKLRRRFFLLTKRTLKKGKAAVAVLLAVLLVTVLAIAGCGGPKPAPQQEAPKPEAKPIELKLAHFWPSTHQIETVFVPGLAKAIEQATNGRVKVVSYSGEILLKAAEIYDGVVKGVADIGISCYSYTAGRFPVMEAFELPGTTYNNSKVSDRVAWEGAKKLNPKELQDTKHLMIISTGPGHLFTKTPVQKLADLKGMEIRATGVTAKTLPLLGATAVAMPQSEAYEALSRGVVKGNIAPLETLKGFKFGEVVKYVTDTPFLYNTLFFVTMNKDKFNSLPPDLQKAIEDACAKYYEEKGVGFWDSINDAGVQFAKEKNVQFLTLSDQEKALWIERLKPIRDDYLKRMKEKGLSGEEVLQTIQELADKYNKEYK